MSNMQFTSCATMGRLSLAFIHCNNRTPSLGMFVWWLLRVHLVQCQAFNTINLVNTTINIHHSWFSRCSLLQLLGLEESLCACVCYGNYHSPIHINLQESLLSSLIVPQAALSEAWTELRLFWRHRDLHSYTNIRGILTTQRAQVTAFSLQEFASVPSTVLGVPMHHLI